MSGRTSNRVVQVAMALLLLAVVFGVGASIYMTAHHEIELYGPGGMQLIGCVEDANTDCGLVNTSAWSEVFGVPTFTWAIPTYLLLAFMAVRVLRGQRQYLLPIAVVAGLSCLFSVWLYYVSVSELGKVCAWCMRLYAVNGATLGLALAAGAWERLMPSRSDLRVAAVVFLGSVFVSVAAQRGYRASLLGDPAAIEALSTVVIELPNDPLAFVDPTGELPARRFEVQTEDGNTATLTLGPADAWKGNPDGRVTVVEFADLQCGYCKRAASQLHRLYAAYGDRVLFVFKHYPMSPDCNPGVKSNKHRYACTAASAARCAQQQGRFWAFHDLAFKNQHQLKRAHLDTYAQALGLDLVSFATCMDDGAAGRAVRADGALGASLDVHGTPRVFIQGELYRAGTSAEAMARAIERALGTPGGRAMRQAAAFAEAPRAVEPIPADVPEQRTMSYGDLTVSIDTFEAGLDDGAATVGRHQIPATRMSWFAATDACEAAGKRLCTEEEWISACQGARAIDDDHDGQFADDMIDGTAYPYGDFHSKGRCWDQKDRALAKKTGETYRPVYTAEMPGCASAGGVYDLTGNVEEWVGLSPETAVLLGGAFDTPSDKARCYRRNDTFGPGMANRRTGFRCCSGPPPAPRPAR